jgi:hypothetical protein
MEMSMRVFHISLTIDDEGVVVDVGVDRPISKRPWRWPSSIASSSNFSREFIDTMIDLVLDAATVVSG